MEEILTTEVNEFIKNSVETAFLTGRQKERVLIGKWLEYEVKIKTPEELPEVLHNAIECLKREVFPDPL
jgi:hypothetical protein